MGDFGDINKWEILGVKVNGRFMEDNKARWGI